MNNGLHAAVGAFLGPFLWLVMLSVIYWLCSFLPPKWRYWLTGDLFTIIGLEFRRYRQKARTRQRSPE